MVKQSAVAADQTLPNSAKHVTKTCNDNELSQTFAVFCMLYVFFWVIPWRMNSDNGELPRRKHTKIVTNSHSYMRASS